MRILRIIGLLSILVASVSCTKEVSKSYPPLLPNTDISTLSYVGMGYAGNSVNTTIFRHSSVASSANYQFISYYNADGKMMLARRVPFAKTWEVVTTSYSGSLTDAHNSICFIVDGDGYLHVSWNHHGSPLSYCKSATPGSLVLAAKIPMTGIKETNVTYPEFYKMPNGDLIFLYRDGASGDGNLMMNYYSVKTSSWKQIQDGLLDGQGQRNAYWQLCIDKLGTIHLSWVWREAGDVSTNHDLCYAQSKDGGVTWLKSTGEKYQLPINASNAEYILKIPQNSELINTTSMCATEEGFPMIATYWRDGAGKLPQYFLVYQDGNVWKKSQISSRKTDFSLSGGGTKRIPISRPVVLTRKKDGKQQVLMIFRDSERFSKASVAVCNDLTVPAWQISDLNSQMVGSWEPSVDKQLWTEKGLLHVYLQQSDQVDGEGVSTMPPQPVYVLECPEI